MIDRKAATAVTKALQGNKGTYIKILDDFKNTVYKAETVKEIIYGKKFY